MNMNKPFLLLVAFILLVMTVSDSIDGHFYLACSEGIMSAVTVFIYDLGKKENDDESNS